MLRQARARSAMDCHSSSVESVVSERTEGKDLRSVEPRRETRLNKNASGPGGHCDSTFQRRSHFEFKVFLGGGGHQVALLCLCRPDSAELLDASADVLAQSRLNVGHFYFFYIGVNAK